MSYLKDPRENRYDHGIENGIASWMEEDNRYEQKYGWGAMVLDLCDLPPEEYAKTIFHTDGSSESGTTKKYTIQYKNGTALLQRTVVEEGTSMPAYTGSTPTKQETSASTFVFSGWNPPYDEQEKASKNVTFSALFTESAKSYTVIINYLKQDDLSNYSATTSATTSSTLTDADNIIKEVVTGSSFDVKYAKYDYTGFTKTINSASTTIIATAKYKETVHEYPITVETKEHTTLKVNGKLYKDTSRYTFGQKVKGTYIAGEHYEFKDDEDDRVSEVNSTEITIKGVYSEDKVTFPVGYTLVGKLYNITFDPDNGESATTNQFEYDTLPTTPADPIKEKSSGTTYTFSAWTPEITVVTGDTEYKALYNEVKDVYTVTTSCINGCETLGGYETGSISLSANTDEINYGTTVWLTPNITEGMDEDFYKWSDDDTASTKTFVVTGNTYVTAYTSHQVVYYISDSDTNSYIDVDINEMPLSDEKYKVGEVVKITAKPKDEYKDNITITGLTANTVTTGDSALTVIVPVACTADSACNISVLYDKKYLIGIEDGSSFGGKLRVEIGEEDPHIIYHIDSTEEKVEITEGAAFSIYAEPKDGYNAYSDKECTLQVTYIDGGRAGDGQHKDKGLNYRYTYYEKAIEYQTNVKIKNIADDSEISNPGLVKFNIAVLEYEEQKEHLENVVSFESALTVNNSIAITGSTTDAHYKIEKFSGHTGDSEIEWLGTNAGKATIGGETEVNMYVSKLTKIDISGDGGIEGFKVNGVHYDDSLYVASGTELKINSILKPTDHEVEIVDWYVNEEPQGLAKVGIFNYTAESEDANISVKTRERYKIIITDKGQNISSITRSVDSGETFEEYSENEYFNSDDVVKLQFMCKADYVFDNYMNAIQSDITIGNENVTVECPKTYKSVRLSLTIDQGISGVTIDGDEWTKNPGGSYDYKYVKEDDEFTLVATAKDGYEFGYWDNDTTLTSATRTVKAGTEDLSFYAHSKSDVNLTLNVNGEGFSAYTVTIDGTSTDYTSATAITVNKGTKVSVKAIAKEGYVFDKWSDGSTTNPTNEFTMSGDTELTASFAKMFNVTLSAATEGVSGFTVGESFLTPGDEISVKSGSSIEVTAVFNNGYSIDKWEDDSTENPRTHTVNGNATLSVYAKEAGIVVTFGYLSQNEINNKY